MKKYCLYIACLPALAMLVQACNSSKHGLFSRKTPHEKYLSALKNAGLSGTTLYNAWIDAAEKGLKMPVSIAIPYKETGFFPSESPGSAGYSFTAQEGEKIRCVVAMQPAGGRIFSELWKIHDTTQRLLYAADSVDLKWEFEIKEQGKYLIRLQPELLHAMNYTITIETGPSLAFPVRATDKPRTSSFWGDSRDRGGRKHEGIDIFAAKRTPAIAAAEGIITRVGTNNLGGNIVFMRPDGKDYSLYYAHLDTQHVRVGERVKTGDIVGLIGNTGNARTTPAHLHFGVYSSSGALDPLPFVNTERPVPTEIKSDTAQLAKMLRTKAKSDFLPNLIPSTPVVHLEKGTLMTVIAATGKWWKVQLPDGREGYIDTKRLTKEPLPETITTANGLLFDRPYISSAIRGKVPHDTALTVYGFWQNYALVQAEDFRGWIQL